MRSARAKTALVTGGAGFLGSHLARRLLAEGHEVVVLDDLSTGRRRDLPLHPRLRFFQHDVREPFDLVGVDRIYHLACPASRDRDRLDAVGTVMTNVLGTVHALRLAERTGARLLLSSTSGIYGDPEVHPQPESYRGQVDPTGPRACHDEGKRVAETLVTEYARERGANVRIARIFDTYGPTMALDDRRVVASFVRQALRGAPLTVDGDGSQTRSPCYVDDLVDGLVGLMEHTDHPGPVNLGDDAEITVLELARTVLRLVPGTGSTLVFRDRPIDDPRRRRPDLGLARRLFGYAPKVGLEEGLTRTIEDLRARLGEQETSILPLALEREDIPVAS